ncbi:hypothetical protein P3L51_29505 [Streptomyces sp. PSRA5]|uniref:hypothetical protein n=1 Tax=Streptomyces panacea TaxID=3035064 RepID=UPI00339C0F3B
MIGKIIQCVLAGTFAAGGLVAAGSLPVNAAPAAPDGRKYIAVADQVTRPDPAATGLGSGGGWPWKIPGPGR